MLVLCISLFMVVVDNLIINVALPTLSRELGASTSGLQWIVDSYALVFACLLLAFGGLGDRFGRKGAIQVGMIAFVGCSIWASFATSTSSLIIARGAMGIGAAAIFPATLAIIIDVFRDQLNVQKQLEFGLQFREWLLHLVQSRVASCLNTFIGVQFFWSMFRLV